jgi:hypothetical protein
MRTRGSFHSFLSAFLLAAALGLFLPVCAHSQTPPATAPPDSGDGNEKPVSFLSVTVTFDPSGKASVNANYFLDDQPNLPPAEIKQALESSLDCSLQNSSRARPMPGTYSADCTVPASNHGLFNEGRILTAPLQNFSSLHNIASSSLKLHLPDSDILETIPPASAPAAETAASAARFKRALVVYTWSPDKPLASEITYRYGYSSSTLKRNAAILLLVLASPLGLFVWLGRRALAADVPDKAVVWFSYMRSLQWILNFSLLGWWLALDYCDA